MRKRYFLLSSFVERGVRDIYAGETDVEMAMEGRTREGGTGLPWRKPDIVGAKMAERMLWGWVGDYMPLPGFGSNNIMVLNGSESNMETGGEDDGNGEVVVGRRLSEGFVVPAVVAVTTAAVAAVIGVFYYAGNVNGKEKRLADMGEAGALFAGLDFGGPAMSKEWEGRGKVVPVGLEVDVSGDGEG